MSVRSIVAGLVVLAMTVVLALANTFWGLEFRPMKENTHFRSINPGFEWHATDRLIIDGHVNYTDSEFYRDMPTVLVATQSAGRLKVGMTMVTAARPAPGSGSAPCSARS